MSGQKRKAEDDLDRMSSSPTPAPANLPQRPQATLRNKRIRTNVTGRPLPLSRLLETLTADEMRTVLSSICDRHPDIGREIVSTAPRPSATSALNVLQRYQSTLQGSFPYGNRNTSDYSYNRVRQPLVDLLDALKEYTPHFLPPNESQPATSLQFLDGATQVVHRLPNWDSYLHNRHKEEAYEEIGRAWACVIREAAKKGGGMQLQYNGWDQKLAKHNEESGGKMQEAVTELKNSLGWIAPASGSDPGQSGESMSIRQQLLSGTYGAIQPSMAASAPDDASWLPTGREDLPRRVDAVRRR